VLGQAGGAVFGGQAVADVEQGRQPPVAGLQLSGLVVELLVEQLGVLAVIPAEDASACACAPS
jgi:hypothetical protein